MVKSDFRGETRHTCFGQDSCKTDHLVMFFFGLPLGELNDDPLFRPKMEHNQMEFEFQFHTPVHSDDGSYVRISSCGVRVLSGYPSGADSGHNQQSGEKCDVEIERNKKREQMTGGTFEESSNMLCGQIVENTGLMAQNLELSLGQREASTKVSSISNLHGERALLCLSLSPPYPSLEEEASCVVPMITEQQDTETPTVDLSSSPKLINFFS